MVESVGTHGVTRRDAVHSDIDAHVEEIRRLGVTVIERVFSEEEVERLRRGLHAIYQKQIDDVGGEDELRLINDANIVRSPLVYDDAFVDVAKQPLVLSIARALLGPRISLASQVGILNKPAVANYQEKWHRELQFQHFTSSRPLAVQTLVAVDEFTAENGATFFLDGSHLFENFPSDTFVRKWERQRTAPAGSVLMFDSLLYHRGAPNRTGRERLAINNLYTLPILAQQIDLANMLDGRLAETQEDRELFGYQWNPSKDVLTWRRQRIASARS